MNKNEILTMSAGREIDTLIAEQVMGWHIGKVDDDWLTNTGQQTRYTLGTCYSAYPIWQPSTDIAAAWRVSEKFVADKWEVTVEHSTIDGTVLPTWRCWLNYFTDDEKDFRHAEGEADTAPLAICRAALLAVMKDKT